MIPGPARVDFMFGGVVVLSIHELSRATPTRLRWLPQQRGVEIERATRAGSAMAGIMRSQVEGHDGHDGA